MAYGKWDIRSYVESEGSITKFTEYMNQMLERVVASIKQRTYENEKNGNDDDDTSCIQFVGIVDMSAYSYRQIANIKSEYNYQSRGQIAVEKIVFSLSLCYNGDSLIL